MACTVDRIRVEGEIHDYHELLSAVVSRGAVVEACL